MTKNILVLFILLLTFNNFCNEIKKDETLIKNDDNVIEYRAGKGLFKNDVKIESFKDYITALSPVPEALKLYKKSINKFAVSFSFAGILLVAGTTELILTSIYYDYEFTKFQYILYQAGITCLSLLGAASLVIFIIFLAVGIAQYKNSILLYNTEIYKKINKKISLFPDIDIENDKVSLTIKYKI